MNGDQGRFDPGDGADTFERWFRAHHGRLLSQCRRMLGEAAAAEDVAQETLLRAWLGRDRMREEDVGAWLSVVARNLCISYLRRQKKQIPTETLPETADETIDPARVVERLESRRAVRRALRLVGERERDLLVRREVDGVNYEDLGAGLGLTAGGTRTVLFRTRRALRDRLAAVGEGLAGVVVGFKVRVRAMEHRARAILNDSTMGSVVQAGATALVAVTVAVATWHVPGVGAASGREGTVRAPAEARELNDPIARPAKTSMHVLAVHLDAPRSAARPLSPIKPPVVNPPACGERPSVVEETQAGLPYELRGTVWFNGEGVTGPYTDAAFKAVDENTTFPNECESQGGTR
jgi:RNA polymerase sigma-70 factor (ECF subfamily)